MHYENGRAIALMSLGIKKANALVHVPGMGRTLRPGLSNEAKARLLTGITGTAGGAVGGALVDDEDPLRGALWGGGVNAAGGLVGALASRHLKKNEPAVHRMLEPMYENMLKRPGTAAGVSAGSGMLSGAITSGIASRFRGTPEQG
jgi:hypothetical protein